MFATILTIAPLVLGLTIVILAMIRKMKPAPVATGNEFRAENKSVDNRDRIRTSKFEEVKRNG